MMPNPDEVRGRSFRESNAASDAATPPVSSGTRQKCRPHASQEPAPTRHPPASHAALADEHGYTLVEVVVAAALLLAVLVPAGAALTTFAGQRPGERLALATRSAHAALEKTLSEQSFVTDTLNLPAAPWPIHRTVHRERGLVVVTVATGPPQSPRPLVTLATARLDPHRGEPSDGETRSGASLPPTGSPSSSW